MANISKLSEKTLLVKNKIERLTSFKWACVRLSTYYLNKRNTVMYDIMEIRIAAVNAGLKRLYEQYAPLETARLVEYRKTSAIHHLYLTSKGLNGSQILIANKLK